MLFSVTELVTRLKNTVETEIGQARVTGEIGSCKTAASGHIYFTLKDEHAQLQCVLYRYQAISCPVVLREGLQVELTGNATVWEGRGSLQFIVSRVKEAGIGSLQQRFEELKRRLQREGLFDTSRKRPLPAFPQSVGLITSAAGAVIQDMRHRLQQRAPWIHAYLLPVQVQGKGAEHGIARAIRLWGTPAEHGLPAVDYLILARGGGSMEDLWCFNEEAVARAIADCSIPVVSAVGHETDFTIADFVADLRAPTPTAAIELTTPDGAALMASLEQTGQHLTKRLRQAWATADLRLRIAEQGRLRSPLTALAPFAQRLDVLEQELHILSHNKLYAAQNRLSLQEARLSTRSFRHRLDTAFTLLQTLEQRLGRLWRERLAQAEATLQVHEAHIQSANPHRALERGFALVRTPSGRLARQAAELPPGTALDITLATGRIAATVTSNSL